MKIKVLLAEDDINLGYIVSDQLKNEGFEVNLALDGSEAILLFNQENFHICVLDVMMPKKDGFTLAKDIRKINKEIPILFLTAKSLTEDKIEGFKIGGDDYLTKPFDFQELILRIKSLLKRVDINNTKEIEDVFKIGNFTFDSRNLTLSNNSLQKKLTKKENSILKCLCRNKNQIVSREIIMNTVWGQEDYFIGRSLDVFVTKLRKYLSDDETINISNIHGIGFKLETN